MLLVIGGCFQGKLAYVMERQKKQGRLLRKEEILAGEKLASWLEGTEKSAGAAKKSRQQQIRAVNGLHRFVYQRIVEEKKEDEDRDLVEETVNICQAYLEELLMENPDLTIICDEVGYGVVPIQEKERCYREAVGRLLCFLAQKADAMVRIIGGMPVRIK